MDWTAFRPTLSTENIRIMDGITTNRPEKCLNQWYTQIGNSLKQHCPEEETNLKIWMTHGGQVNYKNSGNSWKQKKKDCLRARLERFQYQARQNWFHKLTLENTIEKEKQYVRSTGRIWRNSYRPRHRHPGISNEIPLPINNPTSTSNTNRHTY